MIVIKFGGTSVGETHRLRQAIEIVAERRERRPVVVVSALAGVTNQLVAATEAAAAGRFDEALELVTRIRERHEESGFALIGQKIDFYESFTAQLGRQIEQITSILRGVSLVGETSPRAKDLVVALGEKLSSVLFSYAMRTKTLTGVHVDSGDVIVTDDRFGEATPLMAETTAAARLTIVPESERSHIPVLGGFFGRSLSGATTTLGRGGSDYSAALIGAAIGAEEIQIWTDVDGMMTCDPRVIPAAKVLDLVTYDEAAELAYFGAKVLHPKTLWPAVEGQIPVRVLNTHNPASPGTLITRDGKPGAHGPRALAMRNGITVVQMTTTRMLEESGYLARLFDVFARHGVAVDLVTTSEVSVSATVDDSKKLDALVRDLTLLASVSVIRDRAVIAIVGRDLTREPEVAAALFRSLAGIPVSMMTLGSSGLNLSVVVDAARADEALRSIHRTLFEGGA
ncbi:MAG: aspartate kinase [Thermoanaerobaculia bacterium]|nr:aspartate kinase [Thermoanaerobaculia bacterium]